jgi:peptide/nickel transport system substrate-binding protein
LALGASIPAVALIAACGSDDDAPTATTASAEPTAASTPAEATATGAMADPTATTEAVETPAATEAPAEATPTEGEAEEPTPTSPDGAMVEGGDRLMGQEFEEGQPGGTLIDAIPDPLNTNFAEWRTTGVFSSIRIIFEGLIEVNPFSLEPVGLLAEGWEVADDGVTWTYYLRQGVSWHDGGPFTAEDVVFSYGLHMNEAAALPYTSGLVDQIAAIEAVDDHTVVFTATAVLPDFLLDAGMMLLGSASVLGDIDQATWNESGAATGADPALVVGTGPFRFVEMDETGNLTTERFDAYWDGAPYLDRYICRYQGDAAARMTGILSGENDFVYAIEMSYVEQFEEAGATLGQWIGAGFDGIVVNLDPARDSVLLDPMVRQALILGLDREAIILGSWNGYGDVAEVILPPMSVFANPEGVTVRYPYDLEQANALLDEAGWVPGGDGIREKDGRRLSFNMIVITSWAPYSSHAIIAQEQWRQLGAELIPEFLDDAAWVDRWEQGDYDTYVAWNGGGLTPDRTDEFACGSLDNKAYYCNEEVDTLLEEARVETDLERRIELYTEFQNIILTDLPTLPIGFEQGFSVAAPRVHNSPRVDVLANPWYAVEKMWVEG